MNDIKPLSLTAIVSKLGYQKYSAEPKNKLKFSDYLKSAAEGVLSKLSSGVTEMIGIDPEYQALLEKQMEFQQQMMQVSLFSNLERTRHETKMAAVRNLRVA